MFKLTNGRGFHLTFKNGITLSTQIGWGNYCDNHNYDYDNLEEVMNKNNWESSTCEIAIFDKDGEWLTESLVKDADMVKGYVTFDEWLKIVDICRNYKNEKAQGKLK